LYMQVAMEILRSFEMLKGRPTGSDLQALVKGAVAEASPEAALQLSERLPRLLNPRDASSGTKGRGGGSEGTEDEPPILLTPLQVSYLYSDLVQVCLSTGRVQLADVIMDRAESNGVSVREEVREEFQKMMGGRVRQRDLARSEVEDLLGGEGSDLVSDASGVLEEEDWEEEEEEEEEEVEYEDGIEGEEGFEGEGKVQKPSSSSPSSQWSSEEGGTEGSSEETLGSLSSNLDMDMASLYSLLSDPTSGGREGQRGYDQAHAEQVVSSIVGNFPPSLASTPLRDLVSELEAVAALVREAGVDAANERTVEGMLLSRIEALRGDKLDKFEKDLEKKVQKGETTLEEAFDLMVDRAQLMPVEELESAPASVKALRQMKEVQGTPLIHSEDERLVQIMSIKFEELSKARQATLDSILSSGASTEEMENAEVLEAARAVLEEEDARAMSEIEGLIDHYVDNLEGTLTLPQQDEIDEWLGGAIGQLNAAEDEEGEEGDDDPDADWLAKMESGDITEADVERLLQELVEEEEDEEQLTQ
jgi:hypothetical protein